jgi:hypothetical protein
MKHSSEKRKTISKLIQSKSLPTLSNCNNCSNTWHGQLAYQRNFVLSHNTATEIKADYTFHYISDPPTYCPKDPVLKLPQAVFFPQCEKQGCTVTQNLWNYSSMYFDLFHPIVHIRNLKNVIIQSNTTLYEIDYSVILRRHVLAVLSEPSSGLCSDLNHKTGKWYGRWDAYGIPSVIALPSFMV